MTYWAVIVYEFVCFSVLLAIVGVTFQLTRDVLKTDKEISKGMLVTTYACLLVYLELQIAALGIVLFPIKYCGAIGVSYGFGIIFSKVLLYRLFIYRLELAFDGSVLKYSARYLNALKCLLMVFILVGMIIGHLYSKRTKSYLSECFPFVESFVLVYYAVFDIIFIFVVFLKQNKTKKKQRPLLRLIGDESSAEDSKSREQREELIHLTVKCVTLVTTCMVTTVLNFCVVAYFP
ncbi:hypothetical protein RFI_10589, partial [Reticulomyxa filosa]